MDKIAIAKEKFGELIEEQLKRVEKMKLDKDFIDFQIGFNKNWYCRR